MQACDMIALNPKRGCPLGSHALVLGLAMFSGGGMSVLPGMILRVFQLDLYKDPKEELVNIRMASSYPATVSSTPQTQIRGSPSGECLTV